SAKHRGGPLPEAVGERKEPEMEAVANQSEGAPRRQREKWSWGRNRPRRDSVDTEKPERKRGPAHAYQFGSTIIVEDEDGEVIKKYTLADSAKPRKPISAVAESPSGGWHRYSKPADVRRNLHRMGTWMGVGGSDKPDVAGEDAAVDAPARGPGESE